MTTDAGVRRRIERLRATSPAAADLATLLSTAVRIEPALVRRMRLLLPRTDVGAELDLWSSELVASASPLAMSLEPACAEALRADLASPSYAEFREAAADVVEAAHAGLHWSLRLEERINRLMVRGDLEEAERLLFAAIAELRSAAATGPAGAAETTGIARWLLAALGRIPRALAGTEGAVVAGLGAGTQLDGRFDPPPQSAGATEAWMPWLLAAAAVEARTVQVRFFDGSLTVNDPGPGEVVVLLPGTDPLVLDVTWHDGISAGHERLRFRPGERAGLHVGADDVTLQALSGERWRLSRPRRRDASVTGLDFSAVRARMRPCLGRRREVDELVQLGTTQRVVAVTGEAGIGKSVLVNAALDTLEQIGYLVVDHVYGVHEGWDEPEVVTASLEAKLRAALGPALDVAEPLESIRERRRRALLVANTRFGDRTLPDLEAAALPALAEGLAGADPPGFDVETLNDGSSQQIQEAVQRFVGEAGPDDELFLYVATYGVVEGDGLYLVAADGTFAATTLLDLVRRSAAASTGLVLDCYDRPRRPRTDDGTDRLGVSTPSLAVLLGWTQESRTFVLANDLIAGLRSGAADDDGDGAVSVGDLTRYLARSGTPVWTSGDQDMLLAPVAPHDASSGRVLLGPILSAAGRAAQGSRLRGVALALDDVPVDTLDRLPIVGPVPPGVTLVLTTRAPAGALEQAFAPDRPAVATLNASGSDQVCREIIRRRREELTLAFGGPPHDDELVRLAAAVPGRLAGLLDWLLDQPVGRARVSEAPPTLTGPPDEVWNDLDMTHLQALGVIAAARSGFTIDDLGRVLARTVSEASEVSEASDVSEGSQATPQIVDDLARRRFVRADGPFDEPATTVRVTHASVAAAYAEEFDAGLRLAHGQHALAFPHADPSAASTYQLGNAAHHHAVAGAGSTAVLLARSGGYLDLRQRSNGLDALDADLAALTPIAPPAAQIRTAMALCRTALEAEPERFAELVDNALRALGDADLAETAFHWWRRSPLRVRAVHEVADTEILWRYEGPVMAAVRGPSADVVTLAEDGVRVHPGSSARPPVPVTLPDGAPVLALAGEAVVVGGAGSLTVIRPTGGPEHVNTNRAAVRSLLADGSSVAAGLDDGTVLHLRVGPRKTERRALLGHSAAVTALAWSPAGLLSAGDDGTVRLWDVDLGVARLVYWGHSAPVVALAVAPSGVFSADSEGRLRWWDPLTGGERGVLAGTGVPVTAIGVLGAGVVVTVTADGAIRRWHFPMTGRPVDAPLRAPGPPLLRVGVATGRFGGPVVGWSTDGVLTWWDAEAGDVLQRLRLPGVVAPVHDVLVSDEAVIVVHAQGLVACPHPTRAPATVSASLRRVPADAYLDALFLALNEVEALVGTATGMVLVNLTSGSMRPLAGQPVVSLGAWGSEIVSVNADGGIAESSGTEIRLVESRGNYRRVVSEDWPVGSAGAWLQSEDGSLVDYRGEHDQSGRHVPLEPGDTAFAAVRAERRLLAIGGRTGTVRVLEPYSESNQADVVRLGAAAVTALAFTSARRLVAGDADGTVWRIDLDGTGTPVALGRHQGAVTGLAALRGTEQAISAGADGTLRRWDLESGSLLAVVGGPVAVRALAAESGVVAARDQEGRLWVLDADDVLPVPATRDRVLLSGSFSTGSTSLEYTASFAARLRTRAPVELRRVQLVTDPPLRGAGSVQVRVSLDGVPVQVDGTGRLAVPRRLAEDADVQLDYALRVTAPRPPGERTPDLRLTLWSPESGEDDLTWSSAQERIREETPA